MATAYLKQIPATAAIAVLLLGGISCRVVESSGEFYGSTTPPQRNILRYVTGDEPESLDPQGTTGQPEGRIFMALYEGLVEYHPKTMEPIPAIAETWQVNNDSSEFVFHLRRNARWSNGDGITANDFVYSFRRGVAPETASRNANLANYIKYAAAFNSGAVFVKDPLTNRFLLEKDFADKPAPESLSQMPLKAPAEEYSATAKETTSFPETTFHQYMHSPPRLTLPGDEKKRNTLLASNPELQAAVAGKEMVKVTAEDIGVEAVDDYTLRISLSQGAPYFEGLLANQFFRLVPRKAVEKYGRSWTDPGHIITCGPFKLKSWKPYAEIVVERDPMYWDAANVHLDEIYFYPMSDLTTAMNLYKVGEIDAALNHVVPNTWLDVVRSKKDYMEGSEAAITYIYINVTKPPMNDVRVRKAFNMAIDRDARAISRKVVKPLTAFTPEGIFKGYPQPKGDGFNPEKARQLLGEAGFPVTARGDGSFSCPKFPVDQVEYIFNTSSSNAAMAEFMQAQWKQNLGITVPLRNMEFKTFVAARPKLEYKGFALGIFGADYMDPFTFLNIFSTPGGDNGSGWWDKKYVDMLDEANRTLDKQQRYALLAKAEKYLIDAQPIIPIETPAVNFVKKPYVKGMYPNAGSMYPWKYVYIERDPAKWDYGTPSLTD
ncbi:MAG TPA: peptide ABC transporter substrate-binding protein [Pyrinomonadaceae bacterium]|jgi:oligopeptide transport system substrate-binding protein